jgi:hypothetical protein
MLSPIKRLARTPAQGPAGRGGLHAAAWLAKLKLGHPHVAPRWAQNSQKGALLRPLAMVLSLSGGGGGRRPLAAVVGVHTSSNLQQMQQVQQQQRGQLAALLLDGSSSSSSMNSQR